MLTVLLCHEKFIVIVILSVKPDGGKISDRFQ